MIIKKISTASVYKFTHHNTPSVQVDCLRKYQVNFLLAQHISIIASYIGLLILICCDIWSAIYVRRNVMSCGRPVQVFGNSVYKWITWERMGIQSSLSTGLVRTHTCVYYSLRFFFRRPHISFFLLQNFAYWHVKLLLYKSWPIINSKWLPFVERNNMQLIINCYHQRGFDIWIIQHG